MSKINGRKLTIASITLLDAVLVPYAIALAVRDSVSPPSFHLRVPSSQVEYYQGQNIEIAGIVKSVDYRPGLAGRGLEITLQADDGRLLNAESRIFPASLVDARNARRISYEDARQIYDVLEGILASRDAVRVILRGRYSSADEILKLHSVEVGGKVYNLFMPN